MFSGEIWRFVCQDCTEGFMSHPLTNAWCAKCRTPHVLCPACKAVHELTFAEQDHYLALLDAQ
jgi:uncharacterized CHY-type Zn-finger protein